MCEGQNNLSALNRSRRSINPGGSLAFLALCPPFLVWKLSRPSSEPHHFKKALCPGTLSCLWNRSIHWKCPWCPSVVICYYTDCRVLMFPVKMRICPLLLNVNAFRDVERDIKWCGEIGKIMLLAFPFQIEIAEFHRGVPSPTTAWKWKPRLSYSNSAAGNAHYKQCVSLWWCGKTLQVLYYLSRTPTCLPSSWHALCCWEALCILLCVCSPTPGPWFFHQLFSNKLFWQSNTH